MKAKFVDTNIFIRFITVDDPIKAKKCYQLFQKAEKKEIILTTTESIMAEVVYILASQSLYGLSAQKIHDLLLPIINMPGLKLSFKKILIQALQIYASKKIDFEDAYLAAFMFDKNIKELYSYDRDFDKLAFIKRKEP